MGLMSIIPSKKQSMTSGPPVEASIGGMPTGTIRKCMTSRPPVEASMGGMPTGTIRKCMTLSASTMLLCLLPLRWTSFLKGLILTTMHVPSTMGMKIMSKTSEGSLMMQCRGITVMTIIYSILVVCNLKMRRVTHPIPHPWHYPLNAVLGLMICPDIPNRPILSPHVFEAIMV